MITIQEFIFDGVTDNPNIPEQGMDMHSFYDGMFTWYPYCDYTDYGVDRNKLLRYRPATGELKIIQLADSGVYDPEDALIAYQAIPGLDSDEIFISATYNSQRSIWKYTKSTGASTYTELNVLGTAGGKMAIALDDAGEETVLLTSTLSGKPVAYRTSDSRITELTTLGDFTYGCQTDGRNNFFMADIGNKELQAYTFDAAHAPNETAADTTLGAVDIAWDGEFVWCASQLMGSSTNVIEQFKPFYVGNEVTRFDSIAVHYTGNTTPAVAASIKASAEYVVAAWEGGSDGTLGWSILTRATGKWTHFSNAVSGPDVEESVYPFTSQFWTTVTVEIDVPGEIYITGYSPELQGGYMEEGSCPNHSMRMLKFTMNGSMISDGILSDGTLY